MEVAYKNYSYHIHFSLVFSVQSVQNTSNSHSYLLQSDDSIFLNLTLDNVESPIGNNNSNFPSFESPEINLSRALIAPNLLKRKSSEGMEVTCKKRLLDDVSFEETSVTDTQLLQANAGVDNPTDHSFSRCSNEQFLVHDPELFFNTQFELEKEFKADFQKESQIERNSLNVTKLNLTQVFNDDFEEEIQENAAPESCKQSQMFLDIAKTMTQMPRHQTQKLEELDGRVYKSKNASMYIELQRSMQLENETNVIDDNFVDPELSQAIKTTQYRKEIEADFNKCEKTIRNFDNLNDSNRSVDLNNAFNIDDLNEDAKEINWNSPYTPAVNASSVVKKRLAEFSKSRDSSMNDHSGSSFILPDFAAKGPFFGLPIEVKDLIREYKGIDKLYGK